MQNEPIVSYGVPLGAEPILPHTKAHAATASREASEREMDYLRALNQTPSRQTTQPPPFKEPTLPEDFQQRLETLDKAIFGRGIAIDGDKLLAVGKTRFAQLLELDHTVRDSQRIGIIVDLTSWPSVAQAFQMLNALHASEVPRVKNSEIYAGHGKERQQAAVFNGFDDLWKARSAGEPETVRNVLAFYDAFASLVFGQSLFVDVDVDNRVRNRFFAGGRGRKVELFETWRAILRGSLVTVRLPDALWHVVAWLCNERTPKPDTIEVARSWFNARVPNHQQFRIVQAVLNGFALGHTGWTLWNYVGHATRTSQPQELLNEFHKQLAASFPRITGFHHDLKAAFYTDVGMNARDSHRQFDPARHRAFIDGTVQGLLDIASAVSALAVEATCANALVARFQNQLLLEVKKPPNSLRGRIESDLSETFPQTAFAVEVKEATR